jgi:hypothetical protein
VSKMRQTPVKDQAAPAVQTIALAVSDVHFCHTPPICRAGEPDWYAALDRQWSNVYEFWSRCGGPPILIAGDLFDKWNPPYELWLHVYNLFKRYFPPGTIITIPGQHDLPNHSLDHIHRSAYGALCETGVVVGLYGRLNTHHLYEHNGIRVGVVGYPWGTEQTAVPEAVDDWADITIALTHRYAYDSPKHAFHGAPDASKVTDQSFPGYTFVHYGDNHIRWKSGRYVNPGSFYRRHSSDVKHMPGGYYLKADATVRDWYIDTVPDVFEAPNTPAASNTRDVSMVVRHLSQLTANTADVGTLIRQAVEISHHPQTIKDKILGTLV